MEDSLRERKPSEKVNSEPAPSEKEAYFQLLRAWVNQANMSQNAIASFPYYLIANYPQIFQPITQPTVTVAPPPPAGGGNNLLNGRVAEIFDPARNENSTKITFTQRKRYLFYRFFRLFLQ
jgi:hypothetical protein